MARYRLTQRAFINDRIHEEGDVVFVEDERDVIPGPHMEPLDDAAQAAKDKAGERTLVPGDPAYIHALIANTDGKAEKSYGVVVDDKGVVRGVKADPAPKKG